MFSAHKYAPVAVPVIDGDENALREGFFATVLAPAQKAHPYLEVVAPATLPEVSSRSFRGHRP